MSNNKPDFREQTATPMSFEQQSDWIEITSRTMRSKGATDIRASQWPITNVLLMEGWVVRPEVYPSPEFIGVKNE